MRVILLSLVIGLLVSCNSELKTGNMKNLNLVEKSKQFINAFEARDVATMKSFWSDSTVYRIPYASGMMPPNYKGHDEFHEFTKDLPEMFDHIELDIIEIIEDKEARKVVVRTEIKLNVKDFDPYENAQVFILRFNEQGDLLEVSEYFNPVPTAIGLRKFGTHDRIIDSLTIK